MGKFKLLTDLTRGEKEAIEKIQDKPSNLRTTEDNAVLTARSPYLTNEVIERDEDNLITKAAGNTLPTGDSGFKKGATFIKKDDSGSGVYVNTGNESSSTWVAGGGGGGSSALLYALIF